MSVAPISIPSTHAHLCILCSEVIKSYKNGLKQEYPLSNIPRRAHNLNFLDSEMAFHISSGRTSVGVRQYTRYVFVRLDVVIVRPTVHGRNVRSFNLPIIYDAQYLANQPGAWK